MAERPLHIGIDGRELIGQPTGVGRYLARVLECWLAAPGFRHRLTVFLHGDPPLALAGDPRIGWHVDRAAHGGTTWEQMRLPRALARAGVDVLFAVGYTAPVRVPCPVVVVVHDVSFFTHPEWFGWREGLRRRWFTKQTARRAATVLTVSRFSAGEIERALGISPERIRLAPPGAPAPAPPTSSDRAPLVLFVGSILNRRHVPDLIEGFAAIPGRVPGTRLVLVGSNRSVPFVDPREIAARLGIGQAVEWLEYVDDGALERLYAQARVFAFLSEYEGFAMTPMEALAAGVPPVLADTPVAREVYADAALRVPLDRARIDAALMSLLTDGAARDRVLAARAGVFARFSWQRTADTILAALEQAAPTP
jgi:glycosyltransferase involved in cell wall biosynthesis